ncbi:MAG TPA: hypothetical protein VIJ28_03140 [Chloroflexota bacterium]|jgi:hypothetical protein
MVCPRCTLLHPAGTNKCSHCGTSLRGPLEALSVVATENAPTSIGVISGASLLSCLALALIVPSIASAALSIGSYVGIISITNIWLSLYRGHNGEWLRGVRGVAYSGALLISLVAEVARLDNLQTMPVPTLGGAPLALPVPTATATELLAALLIILDPLVVRPLVHWIEEGVERGEAPTLPPIAS